MGRPWRAGQHAKVTLKTRGANSLQPQVLSGRGHSGDRLLRGWPLGRSTGSGGEEAWLLLTALPPELSQSCFIHRRRDSDVGS